MARGEALGYRRLITFTTAGGSGASLRGAGWHLLANHPPRAGLSHWWTRSNNSRSSIASLDSSQSAPS